MTLGEVEQQSGGGLVRDGDDHFSLQLGVIDVTFFNKPGAAMIDYHSYSRFAFHRRPLTVRTLLARSSLRIARLPTTSSPYQVWQTDVSLSIHLIHLKPSRHSPRQVLGYMNSNLEATQREERP